MRLKPVEEQVVALVGASSGIGREAALRFAERGARVVVAARGGKALDSLVEEIRTNGGEATAVVADVSDPQQMEEVAHRAVREYGGLDTWVHLASISVFAPFERITPEEFRRVVEVNLLGQAYGAMAALPHIKRRGRGALVHVSSVLGRRSVPLQSPYCASKHGVDGMLESLRVELQHEGWPIGVTNVMPASVNTPFFDKSRSKLGRRPMSLPPVYPPRAVADALIYAAEKAPRDLVVGGAGKAMLLNQRLSPRLMDALMGPLGYRWQQMDEPKDEYAPDYLYGPLQDDVRTEGSLGRWAVSSSLSTWLDTHPTAKAGLAAATVLGIAAALRAR
jgi:NAD(P)-dependent dehydrogenase (short-subunit alcohol dehydrogenase family)